MRKPLDRIRHTLSFEIIGLALIIPLGGVLFHLPAHDMGVIGVGSSLVAALWNYVYNLGFDHALLRLAGTVRKSPLVRVVHAVLFEAGLMLVLLPLVAWYLGIGLIEALLLDASLAAFYVVYAFVFNWAYDRVFPLPEWKTGAS